LTTSLYFSDDLIWFIAITPQNIPGDWKFLQRTV